MRNKPTDLTLALLNKPPGGHVTPGVFRLTYHSHRPDTSRLVQLQWEESVQVLIHPDHGYPNPPQGGNLDQIQLPP